MEQLTEVEAIAVQGLVGDRYSAGVGTYSDRPGRDRQLTLIEEETIIAIERERGIALAPGDTRRNLVTRGVALNHLVGRRFEIGPVVLEGVRLCEPCDHLQRLTQKGVLSALIHRGGINAEILVSGTIRAGDRVHVVG